MKFNYFVLGYNAIEYFHSWYDRNQFLNTDLKIIDNGNQNIPKDLVDNVIHSNKRNIGCAGGWNLICDIAFNFYGMDKAIIGQEDGRVSEEIFQALMDNCNETTMCGTYNNGFEFSTFSIHRSAFQKIGRFDENFLFVGCEDNDYKYRANLAGIEIRTLGISHEYNCSIANNDNVKPRRASKHNADYMMDKWGDYKYSIPFNGQKRSKYTDYFVELYTELDNFPSEQEFHLFKVKHN